MILVFCCLIIIICVGYIFNYFKKRRNRFKVICGNGFTQAELEVFKPSFKMSVSKK